MSSPETFVHGWNHRPYDERDWTIQDVLQRPQLTLSTGSPLHDALNAIMRSTVTPKSVKAWATLVTNMLEGAPTPPPPPPPPPPVPNSAVLWKIQTILDQGQTGHCVGFTGADFLQDDPVMDTGVDNALGDAIYYECKVIDGEPKGENGSNMRSLGKALKNRGRIAGYAFATSMDDVTSWLLTKGPVLCGTDWYTGMFSPDANGFVKPTGTVAGGHAWSLIGYDPKTKVFTAQNHWGTNWALSGLFKVNYTDLAALLAGTGEAMVTLELPL